MSDSFKKFLYGLKLLPGIQVRVVLNNGATANNGTGGIPYVLTGSLVAEIDDRLQINPFPCPPANIELDSSPDFLLIDLGTAGVTVLAPGTSGANPTFITLTGIIAINLNSIQIIAPVTPL
ncbi:hypothetical protein [Dendrosporobacter sp. 1207_IL3150]|uniref:hypothetical protein n=1 Tax=Dendrosporobacter sp. 1207_IL3150 TaxID=3084054 RepID=UPI002FD9EF93